MIKSKGEAETIPEVRDSGRVSKNEPCDIFNQVSFSVDNEIPQTCTNGENRGANAGTDQAVCKENEVEIPAGHVSPEHIHLLVFVPPYLSASKLVQYIKGYTSRKLLMEYKDLNRQYWGQHLWARGYFVATAGNITDETIKQYIGNEDMEENQRSDNFTSTEPDKL